MESSVCLPDWSTLLIMESKKVWHIWWEVAWFCCCLNPKFPILLLLLLLSWRFVLARVLHSLLLEWNSCYCCCCHGDLRKQPIVFSKQKSLTSVGFLFMQEQTFHHHLFWRNFLEFFNQEPTTSSHHHDLFHMNFLHFLVQSFQLQLSLIDLELFCL